MRLNWLRSKLPYKMVEIKKPEITKKISTPVKPPVMALGKA
jgi:hypothetical protein